MSIKKTYLKSRPVCKVNFKLDADHTGNASESYLAGSFNGWDTNTHPMKKLKNGSFSLELELASGQDYLFRYYLADGTWLSEQEADGVSHCEHTGAANSVLKL